MIWQFINQLFHLLRMQDHLLVAIVHHFHQIYFLYQFGISAGGQLRAVREIKIPLKGAVRILVVD